MWIPVPKRRPPEFVNKNRRWRRHGDPAIAHRRRARKARIRARIAANPRLVRFHF